MSVGHIIKKPCYHSRSHVWLYGLNNCSYEFYDVFEAHFRFGSCLIKARSSSHVIENVCEDLRPYFRLYCLENALMSSVNLIISSKILSNVCHWFMSSQVCVMGQSWPFCLKRHTLNLVNHTIKTENMSSKCKIITKYHFVEQISTNVSFWQKQHIGALY